MGAKGTLQLSTFLVQEWSNAFLKTLIEAWEVRDLSVDKSADFETHFTISSCYKNVRVVQLPLFSDIMLSF